MPKQEELRIKKLKRELVGKYKRIGKYNFLEIPRFPDDVPLNLVFDKAMAETTGEAHIGLIMALCDRLEKLQERVKALEEKLEEKVLDE